jgi:cytochrome P450
MFGTDGDSTASTITVSVVAAALHPEAQWKVQEELDAVIGRDRGTCTSSVVGTMLMGDGITAPTFADENDLPQLRAFILETFRWNPVVGGGGVLLALSPLFLMSNSTNFLGFPHKATEDIVWEDYVIPKGATVVGNIWFVLFSIKLF